MSSNKLWQFGGVGAGLGLFATETAPSVVCILGRCFTTGSLLAQSREFVQDGHAQGQVNYYNQFPSLLCNLAAMLPNSGRFDLSPVVRREGFLS